MWIDVIFQITLLILLGLCLWAAVSDIKSLRIPNIISALIIALYPVAVLTAPFNIDWGMGVFTGLAVLAVGFFLYAAKIFGAGDIKLLAALSLWAGPALMFPFLFATAIAGGALVIIMMIHESLKKYSGDVRWTDRLKLFVTNKVAVPYGVAIAIGAGVIVWQHSADGILVAHVVSLTRS